MFKFLLSAFILSIILVSFTTLKNEATIYENIDSKSKINWRGTHLDSTHGHDGTIAISKASTTVKDKTIDQAYFEVDMSTIQVRDLENEMKSKLIGHLCSSDFFNVSKFSNASFTLSKLIKQKSIYKVLGNLTILGISNEISFTSKIKITKKFISIHTDPFYIDRTNWGINYAKEGSKETPKDYIIRNKIKL